VPTPSASTRDVDAARFGARIRARQLEIAPDGAVARTLHRKGVFATTSATFDVSPTLPAPLQHGPFQAGARHRALVRLSNASGKTQSDDVSDQRGLAVRLTDEEHVQDLLATNWPVSHARNTSDFIAASALLKGMWKGGFEFFTSMPPWDSVRMLTFLRKVLRPSTSMANEAFYSRSQFQLGDKLVEFRWVPLDGDAGPAPAAHAPADAPADDRLQDDMLARHRAGPVRWRLEMRGFVDETTTPTDDGRKAWEGPFVPVGELTLPADVDASPDDVERDLAAVEQLGFQIGNRWSSDERVMKGRGVLNAFREEVYAASQEGRGAVGAAARACPFLGDDA
jgi:catalase